MPCCEVVMVVVMVWMVGDRVRPCFGELVVGGREAGVGGCARSVVVG